MPLTRQTKTQRRSRSDSTHARTVARNVEAIRQHGTLEMDMATILQVARKPSEIRTNAEQDVLSIWLYNKLRKNQLFDSITIPICTLLAIDADITSLSPAENLFAEGDVGRNFFIILSGELQVHKQGQILALLGPGASCGELALVRKAKRSATVRALKACVLLKISKRSYQRILKDHQIVCRNGETIVKKGQQQRTIYFVKSGCCEAIYKRPVESVPLNEVTSNPHHSSLRQSHCSSSPSSSSSSFLSSLSSGFFNSSKEKLFQNNRTPNCHSQKIAAFERGEWFGDIAAFTNNIARFTVVAKGPAVVWSLQQERLPQLGEVYHLMQETAMMKEKWLIKRSHELQRAAKILDQQFAGKAQRSKVGHKTQHQRSQDMTTSKNLQKIETLHSENKFLRSDEKRVPLPQLRSRIRRRDFSQTPMKYGNKDQHLNVFKFEIDFARQRLCLEQLSGALPNKQCGVTPLQDRILGSLIIDFNGGNPELSQTHKALLRCVGEFEKRHVGTASEQSYLHS